MAYTFDIEIATGSLEKIRSMLEELEKSIIENKQKGEK